MRGQTSDRSRLLDAEDKGHALPFREALFEQTERICSVYEMYAEQMKQRLGTF